MDLITQLLQLSAKLYKHLTNIPSSETRSVFIEELNEMLDERGIIIDQLKEEGFHFDSTNKTHVTLYEFDKGIRERINLVFDNVKSDLKNLNKSKKHKVQYLNPYAAVQVMDGRYYDKKK